MSKLPSKALPTDVVDIEGTKVDVRGLSRSEVMKLPQFKGDAEAGENFILSTGTGVSIEEAAEWRNAVDIDTAGQVIDRILQLSGLAGKDGKDPQSPSNGPS